MSANPPAFPVIAENGLGHVSDGMTLRDWFAGQALTGDLASQNELTGEWPNNATDDHISQRVALYFRFADAMLAERGKP